MGSSDNSNQRERVNLVQKEYYTITYFFLRKITFMFSLQTIAVFTFTSLVLTGHNVKSSLRD